MGDAAGRGDDAPFLGRVAPSLNLPRMRGRESRGSATGPADADKVWDLIEHIPICMLATHDGEEIRARPMGAYVRRDENAVYFLTDARRHKDDEIARDPRVCLSFADTRGQSYVSITGRAAVLNDRAKIEELWSIPAKAWWNSADDPAIRAPARHPERHRILGFAGTVVSYVKMAAAR